MTMETSEIIRDIKAKNTANARIEFSPSLLL